MFGGGGPNRLVGGPWPPQAPMVATALVDACRMIEIFTTQQTYLKVLEEASDGRAAGAPVEAALRAPPPLAHLIQLPARSEREVWVRVHVADIDAREVFAHVLHLHPSGHIDI